MTSSAVHSSVAHASAGLTLAESQLSQLFAQTLSFFSQKVATQFGLAPEKVSEAWAAVDKPPVVVRAAPQASHAEVKVASGAVASGTCTYVFSRGQNKGKPCGGKITVPGSTTCKTHSKTASAAKPAVVVEQQADKTIKAKKNHTYQFYEIAVPNTVDEAFVVHPVKMRPYARRKGDMLLPLTVSDCDYIRSIGSGPVEDAFMLKEAENIKPAPAVVPVQPVEKPSTTVKEEDFGEEDLLNPPDDDDEEEDGVGDDDE